MDTHAFDAITRRAAAGPSRRRSLLTVGGAGLAVAFATPSPSGAAKKKGQVCKKKEKQRCSNDTLACKTTVSTICELEPAQCIQALACCESCAASECLSCLLAIGQP